MKEKIYTSEQMRRNLENGLNNAARKLETLQKVAARDLPGSVWCNNFIWALVQYPDIKFHYRERILKDKAAQLGLVCDFGATLVSEDVKLNHLVFAPLATPNQKDGFNTFIQALKSNKRSSEAAFYANNAEGINLHEKHSSKEDIDIAIKSDWLTIRQAATVLHRLSLAT